MLLTIFMVLAPICIGAFMDSIALVTIISFFTNMGYVCHANSPVDTSLSSLLTHAYLAAIILNAFRWTPGWVERDCARA